MSDGDVYAARELVGASRGGGARGAVRAMRFVRGGASLVSASDDGLVRRARCEDGTIEQVYGCCPAPVALDVTPDERALVGVGAGGDAVLWELASGDVKHRWALDLTEGALLSPFLRDGISTCDAVTVRCAPDGRSAWVCGGGRACVVALTDTPAVMRRMRDVIAVGHREHDGEVERLWFDGRGVHRSPLRAATQTLRGIEAHALRSESRRTPALFSPRGERLVLSTRLRMGIEGGVLRRC